MKLLKLIVFFFIINFAGLYLGSSFMGETVSSNWYTSLDKAPWTPPGWVFGVSWTLIMICFSIYLGFLFKKRNNLHVQVLFIIQIFLNVSWNYIFFNQQLIGSALITILSLTFVLFYYFFTFKRRMKKISYLLLPYMIWLLIASSLNAYILFNN